MKIEAEPCPKCNKHTTGEKIVDEGFSYVKFSCKYCIIKWMAPLFRTELKYKRDSRRQG